MSLPADIARCNGQGCHLRIDCQRYLDNSYQGDRTITMPAAVTCGKGGQVCPNQIAAGQQKDVSQKIKNDSQNHFQAEQMCIAWSNRLEAFKK